MDCGCEAVKTIARDAWGETYNTHTVKFCALHASAPDLLTLAKMGLELAEAILAHHECSMDGYFVVQGEALRCEICAKARALRQKVST